MLEQSLDLVIRGGTVITAAETSRCDIGIIGEKIAVLGSNLPPGRNEIDATGKLVMPGGIDSHCHIDQMSASGMRTADDFLSGTISAAHGGNTTIIPFASQPKGQSLRKTVEDYHCRADGKAIIDYAFHLIISDPTQAVLGQDLPALIRAGYTSFKIYMTYPALRLSDFEILDILEVARRERALVMVHAENDDAIRWLTNRLRSEGKLAPRYHSEARPALVEREATHRAITFSELIQTPLLIVHISGAEAINQIRIARERGLTVYAETCPQYLVLSSKDLEQPPPEGAKYMCSPPLRDEKDQRALWQALGDGLVDVISSDHSPFTFDSHGKLADGPNPPFWKIANGLPGLEVRLPILFSEGVIKGHISLNKFVALTSTNAAKLYGLHPKKGSLAVGAYADIAIWDPDMRVRLSATNMHDNAGFTPYEGMEVQGWPTTTISRGEVVIDRGQSIGQFGRGRFLSCGNSSCFDVGSHWRADAPLPHG